MLPHNYCRNPDKGDRLWCYTGVDEWEYCDVPFCNGLLYKYLRRIFFFIFFLSVEMSQTCQDLTLDVKGVNYDGTVSTTETNKTCKSWIDRFLFFIVENPHVPSASEHIKQTSGQSKLIFICYKLS